MGYQNKELKGDCVYNLTVATFKAAGKDASSMTLGDIGASSDWGAGSDEIKTLKSNGAVDKAYSYVGVNDAGDLGCTVGWYLTADLDDETKLANLSPYCKNDEVLPLGNGLLVFVGSSSTTLTYSGEVLSGDQPLTLKGDCVYNITGNISPVSITLGDIIASEDWGAGSDELKTLKSNGAVDKAYSYVGANDAGDLGCTVGWYLTADLDDETKLANLSPYCKNDVEVAAGEAFVVFVGSSATTITIPSAL